MHIELTQEMEAMVNGYVFAGSYPSAQAVVEEALSEWQAKSSHRAKPPVVSDKLRQLFADFDAAGGAEFVLQRDTRPAEERDFS